jgi:hypothetical protein
MIFFLPRKTKLFTIILHFGESFDVLRVNMNNKESRWSVLSQKIGRNECPADLPQISGYFLELQARSEIHPQKFVSPSIGIVDYCIHAQTAGISPGI